MTAVPLENLPRPDFEHMLCVLPPVVNADGVIHWFAYLDEPSKWHRSCVAVEFTLEAAEKLLRKLLSYERDPSRADRNPNYMAGTVPSVPNLPPQWRVLVAASWSEEQTEWWLELQDDSAWRQAGYDLGALLSSLGRRIVAADLTPQAALSTVPVPQIKQALTTSAPAPTEGSFAKLVRDEMARLDAEIARHRAAIAGVERKMDALNRERRGLTAALSAYEKHARKTVS